MKRNLVSLHRRGPPASYAPSPAEAGLGHLSDEVAIHFLMTVGKQHAPLPKVEDPSALNVVKTGICELLQDKLIVP